MCKTFFGVVKVPSAGLFLFLTRLECCTEFGTVMTKVVVLPFLVVHYAQHFVWGRQGLVKGFWDPVDVLYRVSCGHKSNGFLPSDVQKVSYGHKCFILMSAVQKWLC